MFMCIPAALGVLPRGKRGVVSVRRGDAQLPDRADPVVLCGNFSLPAAADAQSER